MFDLKRIGLKIPSLSHQFRLRNIGKKLWHCSYKIRHLEDKIRRADQKLERIQQALRDLRQGR